MTLRVDGVQITSAYDPLSEAETLARQFLSGIQPDDPLILFGFGLGYTAEAIRKSHRGLIIVVEPDPALARMSLDSRPMPFLADCHLCVGLAPAEAVPRIRELTGDEDPEKTHIIRHSPSVKLSPDYFGEIEHQLSIRRTVSVERLNVLVTTPFYGGSLPIAHYCANAFKRRGHNVILQDNSLLDAARKQIDGEVRERPNRIRLTGLLNRLASEQTLTLARERAVDLVWFVAQSPATPETLQELRKDGIPTAFWFVEDYQLFGYWQNWAPLYDYFFTIQKDRFTSILARQGIKHAHYLPMAADPEIHCPIPLNGSEAMEYGSAVSHVGAGYRNRRMLFARLAGYDFKLWGNDWDNCGTVRQFLQRNGERLATDETVKVFNASKVNLNLHSSAFHDGVNPEGDFLNPRTYEIAACGGFQLVDSRSLLKEQFDEGNEIAVFKSGDDMLAQIDYFLNNAGERSRIAVNGRRRVLSDHTYDSRMDEALRFIYSFEKVPAGRRNPNSLQSFQTVAGEDAELRSLLEQYSGNGVVTVEDIARRILSRPEAKLTRAEAIFLLMNEFRIWAREKDLA